MFRLGLIKILYLLKYQLKLLLIQKELEIKQVEKIIIFFPDANYLYDIHSTILSLGILIAIITICKSPVPSKIMTAK